MGHSKLNTTLLAILSCLLWSTAFAGVKLGLQYETPLQFAGTRFFIAGLLVFPLAWKMNPGYFSIIRKNLRLILLFAFLQTFLQYTLFYYGLDMLPGAVAAVIIGSQPLFIALVASWLISAERLTPGKTLVMLLGIAGVVMVSFGKDPGSASGSIALLGVAFLLIINLISGFSNVLVAKEKGRIPPLVISSSSMIIGGAALFLVSIPVEGMNPGAKPLPYYLSLSWLCILSAVAISVWITLLKRPGIVVSDLNLWKFLVPVFGVIFSWIIIPGEHPYFLTVAGSIVISLALVLFHLLNRRKRHT